MKVIGLAGLKGSGKDTVCQMMCEHLGDSGLRGRRVAFADKVKIAGAKALGFDRPDDELMALMNSMKADDLAWLTASYRAPDGWVSGIEEHQITVREYLQHFGHGCREVFGDTFWIDQILPTHMGYHSEQAWLEKQYPDTDVLIVSDVRYANEAYRVGTLGSVVRVERSGIDPDGHVSEEPIPSNYVRSTLNNNGTSIDLFWSVETCLTELGAFK